MNNNNKNTYLIEAKNLKKHFKISGKNSYVHAVDDVSFKISEGETLGLVGESGCGKSTVGNIVMRLLNPTKGELLYRGKNIYSADKKESFQLRKKMQIVFQDPYSSLNPRQTIFTILSRAYEIHGIKDKNEIKEKVEKLCEEVNIDKKLLNHYPHELDGGNRQIVGIARALSLNPEFVVCDEPVSSLDVSVQAKIINLLMDLQKKRNLSYLFVSHDLSVVKHISHRIAVMYLGQIVEMADTDNLFANPMHPYTIALLSAIPKFDLDHEVKRIVLKGDVPNAINPEPGCRFCTRCWKATEACENLTDVKLEEIEPGHFVACPFAERYLKGDGNKHD